MTSPQGKIYVREGDGAVTFRMEGRAVMRLCPAVTGYIQRSLAGGVKAVRLDLSRCTYMDSTFIGTMLALKRTAAAARAALHLVSPSPECFKLLAQMGMDHFFPIVHDGYDGRNGGSPGPSGRGPDADPVPWKELEPDSGQAEAMQSNAVQAHQELANLPGPAGKQFQPLAAQMAKEWEQRDQRLRARSASASQPAPPSPAP